MSTSGQHHPLGVFLRGMAMGAADVVPGVSGGTLALITGIYEELIETLSRLSPSLLGVWKREGLVAFWRAGNFTFLFSLLAGVLTSITLLASLLRWLMATHPVPLWAFFFGLILASVWLVATRIARWHRTGWLMLATGLGLTAIIVSMPGVQHSMALSPHVFFFSGMLAICAMILPGISGSFILLLLGMYIPVIDAVHHREWSLLTAFVVGCGVGLLSFVHVLKWMLSRWHDAVIALLVGVMTASLWRLWPWHIEDAQARYMNVLPTTYAREGYGDPAYLAALLAVVAGVGVIGVMAYFERRLGARTVDL